MARHPTRWLIPLLSILALPAWAGVEVFTVAGEPIVNAPESAAVVELDAPARLDAQISRDLPADPDRAKQILRSRMSGPDWQATLDRYGETYTGVARAWMLGIEKVPAVVLDGRYVVYGEADVQVALEEIARYTRDEDDTP
ncbi:TIGR03757 family integrating conjugative element protein [Salinicola sp. LHM]|uniref:TIGR03757 family integrating conjugative element protein n=1 Tax=Halomonadaceae TaxID=28256 RepID=UPI000553C1F8|nr:MULTISPECIES: TIGR03757 family integrating conjugative element protein [Halomonadaceae]MDF9434635.1 TIGR03757 family integrating conjugative element protein [Chromohalobacter israelensis]WQH33478.1 TIGR03757 family integrating conjugative element protein [Salinicola sp. LHM]